MFVHEEKQEGIFRNGYFNQHAAPEIAPSALEKMGYNYVDTVGNTYILRKDGHFVMLSHDKHATPGGDVDYSALNKYLPLGVFMAYTAKTRKENPGKEQPSISTLALEYI